MIKNIETTSISISHDTCETLLDRLNKIFSNPSNINRENLTNCVDGIDRVVQERIDKKISSSYIATKGDIDYAIKSAITDINKDMKHEIESLENRLEGKIKDSSFETGKEIIKLNHKMDKKMLILDNKIDSVKTELKDDIKESMYISIVTTVTLLGGLMGLLHYIK